MQEKQLLSTEVAKSVQVTVDRFGEISSTVHHKGIEVNCYEKFSLVL